MTSSEPATVHATASSTVYQQMKRAPFPGQVRTKQWRSLLPPEASRDMWAERAAQYWEGQQQTFGIKFAGFRNDFDLIDGVWIVTTSTMIAEVLPGQRIGEQ